MAAGNTPTFVLFGGTFNPIHEGHVALVQRLLRRPGIQRVFVVPAARNPFKEAEEPLPPRLRLEMVNCALAHLPGVAVLDVELRRTGPSYSFDTVTALVSQYPNAELKLAMGWDVYESFAAWRSAEALLELAGLLVVLRQGTAPPVGKKQAPWLAGLPEEWRGRLRMSKNGSARDRDGRTVVEFINLKLPRISSSQIRRKRLLRHVPAGAREVLKQYWEQGGA